VWCYQMEELSFHIVPPEQTHSEYDWIYIEHGTERIGKVRCRTSGRTLTIYSIIIFSQYEGQGYGKKAVELFKKSYDTVVADRVRPSARGFWEKSGFSDCGGGNYSYRRE